MAKCNELIPAWHDSTINEARKVAQRLFDDEEFFYSCFCGGATSLCRDPNFCVEIPCDPCALQQGELRQCLKAGAGNVPLGWLCQERAYAKSLRTKPGRNHPASAYTGAHGQASLLLKLLRSLKRMLLPPPF